VPQDVGDKYHLAKEMDAILDTATMTRRQTIERGVEGNRELAQIKEEAVRLAEGMDLDASYHGVAVNLMFRQARVQGAGYYTAVKGIGQTK